MSAVVITKEMTNNAKQALGDALKQIFVPAIYRIESQMEYQIVFSLSFVENMM